MTAGLTEPVHRAIATRLRRGQTPDQLISVGKRTDWWTEDDIDWVVDGNDGPRPEGWTLALADDQTPTEGAVPEAAAGDAAGTAPGTSDPGHGYAGPDAQPQVSPSRSRPGVGGGLGASDAPGEPLAADERPTLAQIRAQVDEMTPRTHPDGSINGRHVAIEQTLRERAGHPSYIAELDGPGTFRPVEATCETPPAAADSGEAASDTPAAPVADHRSAPPAAPITGQDLLAEGLQHTDRSVRAAAARTAAAIDRLVSALSRARAS